MPARDSSDCRARWEHACSKELPAGAPASPGKARRLLHVHAAPQRRWLCRSTAMSAQRCWAGAEEKELNYGPQSQSMCWARGHSWPAARGQPNSAALWDTRQWGHQPVSAVSSTVKGILGSMSDTFKAGRQEVS